MFKNKINFKKPTFITGILTVIILAQGLFVGKLLAEKDHKSYEVNLVQINTQKDSVDFLEMRQKLVLMDQTVRDLNQFLAEKNLTDHRIKVLAQDSIASAVYLAKQTNRYSQYLVDLQNKLQQVPLGIPTNGYISSNFGQRKNPIPTQNILFAGVKNTAEQKTPTPTIITKDSSAGAPSPTAANLKPSKNETAPVQMQFHKGLDIAVAYGTDVRAAAKGTVIFAGQRGGYGNCVIVSHGNGLATLYGHLSSLRVKTNDRIEVNQVIAQSGNSGRSTGPHLHYEVHKNNTPVNPKLFMNL